MSKEYIIFSEEDNDLKQKFIKEKNNY